MYSSEYLANTIAHETGHYVGLGHTIDKSHLMYGDDEFTQIPFDDLGLNIPKRILSEKEWERTITLDQRINESEKKLDAYPMMYEGSSQHNQYLQDYSRYQQLINQYNCVIGEN